MDPALREVELLTTPVTLARDQTLPVIDPVSPLLPDGGLRRGSTVGVTGRGATALALAMAAGVSASGSWVVAVGFADLGLSAAAELGADLGRWALVDHPGSTAGEVIASLVGAVDLVLVGPGVRLRAAGSRRVAARQRERGTVLLQVGSSGDVTLDIRSGGWEGIDRGHGRLLARRVEVVSSGRRAAARPRRAQLWLPGPDGTVTPATPAPAASETPARRLHLVAS